MDKLEQYKKLAKAYNAMTTNNRYYIVILSLYPEGYVKLKDIMDEYLTLSGVKEDNNTSATVSMGLSNLQKIGLVIKAKKTRKNSFFRLNWEMYDEMNKLVETLKNNQNG